MIVSLDKYQRHIPFGTTRTTAISDKNCNKKPRLAGVCNGVPPIHDTLHKVNVK